MTRARKWRPLPKKLIVKGMHSPGVRNGHTRTHAADFFVLGARRAYMYTMRLALESGGPGALVLAAAGKERARDGRR